MSVEELSYNYSKSLKFGDDGRSHRKKKFGYLADDTYTGTMDVSIKKKKKKHLSKFLTKKSDL